MRKALEVLSEHRKIILLTAEIFWIVAFLLDAAARASPAGATQFVYVNF